MRRFPLFAVLVLWASALASPLQAQTRQAIRGTLTEEGTRQPLGGAFIALLTLDGERIGATLTKDDGTFLVNVPEPGTFRVRADRIGFQSIESPDIGVEPGVISRVELIAPAQAIEIRGVDVEGGRRCDLRPEAGRVVLGLWEEARKALDVALWTGDAGAFIYDARSWTRSYDKSGRRILNQRIDRRTHVGRHAFQAVSPESLAADGFVQGSDEAGRAYYAPDAQVLLSDPFLSTHCFQAVRKGERMGLMFEPVEGRQVSEVEGTLWFAPGTARLESIEFGYLNSPRAEDDRFGGEVVFEELPGGAWIVRRWEIRMPMLASVESPTGRSRLDVIGVETAGGEVLEVRQAEALLPLSETTRREGSVRGTVYDSTAGAPLARAIVFATGTEHATMTDVDGSFELAGLDEGVYTLAMDHDRLEELGIMSPGVPVEVRAGGVAGARIELPSQGSLVAEACRRVGAEAGNLSVAALGGSIRLHGAPASELLVRITWTRITDSSLGLETRSAGVDIIPDAKGRWGVCRVPPGERVVVEVLWGEATSPLTELGRLEAGSARWIQVEAPAGLQPRP